MSQEGQQRTTPSPFPHKLIWRKRAVAALLGSSAVAALASGASALSRAGDTDTTTQISATHDMLRFLIQSGLYVLLP